MLRIIYVIEFVEKLCTFPKSNRSLDIHVYAKDVNLKRSCIITSKTGEVKQLERLDFVQNI